ncbi:hypothetical protein ACIO14_05565 [Nocardia fluminea]|uniref:hypothetical protein n=1 Tax=Nocardia fluminea TaxID=134984 RepID=UPI003806F49D
MNHHNTLGKVRHYDFGMLPVAEPMQRSLAALFAARCVPHRWTAHQSSGFYWLCVVSFAEFLSRQPSPPRDLDELTAATIKRWRAYILGKNYAAVSAIRSLLRDDPRMHDGAVAEELARRIKPPASRTQSYTESEFERITLAAKQNFRSALGRIERNAAHLQRWRDRDFAEGTPDWALGECLDILARTGDLPRYVAKNGQKSLLKRYRTVLRQQDKQVRWHLLLYLSRLEAVSLGVLLLAEFGWNLSVIDRAEVPQAAPDPGEADRPTYRIPLQKRRRGANQQYETRNVTDDGAATSGRLITDALRATRFARAVVEELAPGTNRLIVWRSGNPDQDHCDHDRHPPVGPFELGIYSRSAREWSKSVAGINGSPFRRGRRTVVALDRREPSQHSQDSHDRHYVLVDKRVQQDAIEVIAAGAQGAADLARKVVLVAEVRPAPTHGDTQTATADCADYTHSPYPDAEGRCGASFLMCLACANAHIHPGHHTRLAHLHRALTNLRSVMQPADWEADWGAAHARLEDLKYKLGEGIWVRSLNQVTADDRAVVDHLLIGELDR